MTHWKHISRAHIKTEKKDMKTFSAHRCDVKNSIFLLFLKSCCRRDFFFVVCTYLWHFRWEEMRYKQEHESAFHLCENLSRVWRWHRSDWVNSSLFAAEFFNLCLWFNSAPWCTLHIVLIFILILFTKNINRVFAEEMMQGTDKEWGRKRDGKTFPGAHERIKRWAKHLKHPDSTPFVLFPLRREL